MALSLVEIGKEVTQLSLEEREQLIRLLIASLEPENEGDVEAAWEREVLRRSREIEEGTVSSVPADEALDRVRRSLR